MAEEICVLISFVLLFGRTAGASERIDYREGDCLVHLLEDGDGTKQTFTFKTTNQITASNTKIRLFINALEIDPAAYTVDYGNHTITMHKALDSGAEISMKYAIAPTFEWKEGVSEPFQVQRPSHNSKNYLWDSLRHALLKLEQLLNRAKNIAGFIHGQFRFHTINQCIDLIIR